MCPFFLLQYIVNDKCRQSAIYFFVIILNVHNFFVSVIAVSLFDKKIPFLSNQRIFTLVELVYVNYHIPANLNYISRNLYLFAISV